MRYCTQPAEAQVNLPFRKHFLHFFAGGPVAGQLLPAEQKKTVTAGLGWPSPVANATTTGGTQQVLQHPLQGQLQQ